MLKKIIKKIYSKYLKNKYGIKEEWLGHLFLRDYKNGNFYKIHRIHKHGFLSTDWNIMGLNEDNYKDYLSTVKYYAMHPINKQYSVWIDDKLTLKYLCSGSVLDKYMPRYYASIDENGKICRLMDYESKNDNANILNAKDIADLLIQKGSLAIKLIQGSIGEGFYKAEYKDEQFLLNGKKMNKKSFICEIKKLKNYLISEYLYTHNELRKYSYETANTMRYLAGRVDDKLVNLKTYIRFGTKKSGYVENYNIGGILCFVNEQGEFSEGNVIRDNKNEVIRYHPETNIELKGKIPMWKEVEKAVSEFDCYFPQLDYLGFDFVITDKNEVKVIEINSLTSLDGFQLREPIFNSLNGTKFFEKYLNS